MINASFNIINNIISLSSDRTINYYEDIVKLVGKHYSKSNFAVFIIQDDSYELKSGYIDNKVKNIEYVIDSELIEIAINNDVSKVLSTKPDELLKKYTLISKLHINNSIIGVVVLSSDNNFGDNQIYEFNAISNIISYKIKDFELNEVYKMQLGAIQDAISEKKQAYEVIKKQHKKLIEIDKSKNLFLANISHELRTPLNAIVGFSQALDARIFGDLNEKQAEYVNDIQISSLHLLGMINEILDISKFEANALNFNPSIINPNIAIKEVVAILEPLYKNKNIKVEIDLSDSVTINADNQKFQQILYNLLSNAIKFTDKNGLINIKSYASKKDYFLEIKDNGIGIDKKYHKKIFNKYVHLSNSNTTNTASTGLGLTITKELVKLHNGKITLISSLGNGSTFKMEFKNIVK